MDQEAFREAMREIGRRGGQARAKSLTPQMRSQIAKKASKAAAAARTKRAKYKKEMSALTKEIKTGSTEVLKKSQAAQARWAKKKEKP